MSPDRPDVGRRHQVVVRQHAGLHLEAGRLRQVDVRRDADAGDHHVRLEVVGQPVPAGEDAHAVILHVPLEVAADLGAEQVVPDHLVLHRQGHLQALHAGAGRDLDADEAAAQHGNVAAASLEQGADRLRVLDRTDRLGALERPRRRSGGQRQPAELDPLAAHLDGVAGDVHRRHVRAQAQLDAVFPPPVRGVHGQLVDRRLAAQEILGQRGPVVGRVLLVADDQRRAVAALLAVLLGHHPAGEPAADDHVLEACHQGSPYSQRKVRSDSAASTAVTPQSTPNSGSTLMKPWSRTMVSRSPFAR